MKIYEFQVVEGYEWVLPVNQGDFEVFRGFDGLPRSQSWRPIAVRLIKKSDDRLLAASDVPWLGKHAPVLRRKALEAMSDLLRADGEVLPLACPEADLNVFNATRVLDALDEERSSLVKFPSSGRTMTIKEHAFRPAALDGANLFKIPQMLRGSVLVTDQVVKRVEGARLRGVAFRKVWEG